MKRVLSIVIISIMVISTFFKVEAQSRKPQLITVKEFLQMLAKQPDHICERVITVNDRVTKIKFAKKQGKKRQEFYPLERAGNLKDENYRGYKIITISEQGKPALGLDPQEKVYTELPDDFSLAPFSIDQYIKNIVDGTSKLRIENAGMVTLDGHQAMKVKLTFSETGEMVYFYFAKDLESMFIRMESGDTNDVKGSYGLANIAFNVPDELFQVPDGYQKISFQFFMATIKHKTLQ